MDIASVIVKAADGESLSEEERGFSCLALRLLALYRASASLSRG